MFGPVDTDMWEQPEWLAKAPEIHEKWKRFVKTQPQELPLEGLTANFCHRKFREFDLNGDGSINSGEFCIMMLQMGIEDCRAKHSDDMGLDLYTFAQNAFDAYDRNVDGELDMREFEGLFKRLLAKYKDMVPDEEFEASRRAERERLEAARKAVTATNKEFEMLKLDKGMMLRIFNLFDKDKGGTLDVLEIASIVNEMGIPDYERDGYIGFIERNQQVSDDNADGTVEFDEFCRLIQSLVTCKMNRNYRKQILAMKKLGSTPQSIKEIKNIKPKQIKLIRGATKFIDETKEKYGMNKKIDKKGSSGDLSTPGEF